MMEFFRWLVAKRGKGVTVSFNFSWPDKSSMLSKWIDGKEKTDERRNDGKPQAR
jgi:hypothetical protein